MPGLLPDAECVRDSPCPAGAVSEPCLPGIWETGHFPSGAPLPGGALTT